MAEAQGPGMESGGAKEREPLLAARMVLLRNMAETLHLLWAQGRRELALDKLNTASRRDLGVLCCLMADCAHPQSRRRLAQWLESCLSDEQTKLVEASGDLAEASGGMSFFARFGKAEAGVARSRLVSEAMARGVEAEPLLASKRQIVLREWALRMLREWEAGCRRAAGDILRAASRSNLGLMCALACELAPPLRRGELASWIGEALSGPPIEAPALAA